MDSFVYKETHLTSFKKFQITNSPMSLHRENHVINLMFKGKLEEILNYMAKMT